MSRPSEILTEYCFSSIVVLNYAHFFLPGIFKALLFCFCYREMFIRVWTCDHVLVYTFGNTSGNSHQPACIILTVLSDTVAEFSKMGVVFRKEEF